MADNAYKRRIANRALAILNAGRTSAASVLFDSIDDSEFADYTTVSEINYPDKKLVCLHYESILKQVIEDMAPEFAKSFADLGQWRKVNKADGGYDYLFELPSDYLALIKQCYEGSPGRGCDCEIMDFADYSHVVCGSDDQAYYCSNDHTSVDDASDGQPPDDDGNGNWTLYNADGGLGASWAASVAYKTGATGKMLATNALSDDDGDSAYIQYLAYVQAGRSDRPQDYPEAFVNAFATRLAAELALDSKDYERRRGLLEEYQILAKPDYWAVQNRHRARTRHKTIFESRSG